MTTLNRKKKPAIANIQHIPLPMPTSLHLDNGIPVHVVNAGTIEALRIEVIFKIGRPNETKPSLARTTAALLKEGTNNKSSHEIAELFDFFGGSLSSSVNLDYTSIAMHCLTKYVDKLLPIFGEIIKEPSFLEDELITFVENSIQDLQVDLAKNEVVAYRILSEGIFGAQHPYGYNSDENSYRNLTVTDLKSFHEQHYHASNMMILVSGQVNDTTLALLNQYFGQWELRAVTKYQYQAATAITPAHIYINRQDSVQTAIAIGRRSFNRCHPDYAGYFVLNTILGGYFGSRLMENIREDKGYTYHIYSSLEPAKHDGYFYIATEVGNEFTEATIHEIYQEISRLQTELVSNKELKMVRNYLLGNMLNLIDGPFNIADLHKTFLAEELEVTLFTILIEKIKTITAIELRDLAQRYLQKQDLWEVVVGVKNS